MGVLDDVVLGLHTRRVPGEATLFAQGAKALPAPRDHLVDIGLVPGIPEDDIARGFEDPMKSESDLHDPEIRAEVSPGRGHLADEELPHLLREGRKVLVRKSTQVLRGGDAVEQTHAALASRPRAVAARSTTSV